jgi:hypothetical protein
MIKTCAPGCVPATATVTAPAAAKAAPKAGAGPSLLTAQFSSELRKLLAQMVVLR